MHYVAALSLADWLLNILSEWVHMGAGGCIFAVTFTAIYINAVKVKGGAKRKHN